MARILIIEDDPDMRQLLAEVVIAAGHEVYLASNGAEGLQLVQEKSLDLLVTDMVMPEKDGLDVLLELHSRKPRLKTIAISGTPPQWTVLESARELGAGKTLTKPFTPKELIHLIDSVLAAS